MTWTRFSARTTMGPVLARRWSQIQKTLVNQDARPRARRRPGIPSSGAQWAFGGVFVHPMPWMIRELCTIPFL
jgi:hypothetical protein